MRARASLHRDGLDLPGLLHPQPDGTSAEVHDLYADGHFHRHWYRHVHVGQQHEVMMSAVPGSLRGFVSAMLETTRQGGHMPAALLVSGIMTGVAGATLTADTDPVG